MDAHELYKGIREEEEDWDRPLYKKMALGPLVSAVVEHESLPIEVVRTIAGLGFYGPKWHHFEEGNPNNPKYVFSYHNPEYADDPDIGDGEDADDTVCPFCGDGYECEHESHSKGCLFIEAYNLYDDWRKRYGRNI